MRVVTMYGGPGGVALYERCNPAHEEPPPQVALHFFLPDSRWASVLHPAVNLRNSQLEGNTCVPSPLQVWVLWGTH